MAETRKTVFCGCVYSNIISEDLKSRVLGALQASDREIVEVPDLCKLAARQDPMLRELAEDNSLEIVACHPRAVKWIFARGGAPLKGGTNIVSMRVDDIEAVIEQFENGLAPDGSAPLPFPADSDGWIPWYPIIDYERCQNCGQCMNFCLFGVYEVNEEKKISVAHPQNCKNNCPACARICPDAAIIFPKVGESPIDGAEINDEEAVHANIKLNVEKILGEDIYATLAERKKKRRQLLRDRQDLERALSERDACGGDKK